MKSHTKSSRVASARSKAYKDVVGVLTLQSPSSATSICPTDAAASTSGDEPLTDDANFNWATKLMQLNSADSAGHAASKTPNAPSGHPPPNTLVDFAAFETRFSYLFLRDHRSQVCHGNWKRSSEATSDFMKTYLLTVDEKTTIETWAHTFNNPAAIKLKMRAVNAAMKKFTGEPAYTTRYECATNVSDKKTYIIFPRLPTGKMTYTSYGLALHEQYSKEENPTTYFSMYRC